MSAITSLPPQALIKFSPAKMTDMAVKQLCAVAAVTFATLIGGAGVASAHDVLVGSDPASGAQLATSPKQVRLTFNEPVKPGYNNVNVIGPDGAQFATGQAQVDGTNVTAGVKELSTAGTYTVAYRVLSEDGHPVDGKFTFTLTQPTKPGGQSVAPAAPPAPGGTPTPAPHEHATHDDDDAGMPIWPWVLGGVVLVAAGATAAFRLGRSSGE